MNLALNLADINVFPETVGPPKNLYYQKVSQITENLQYIVGDGTNSLKGLG